MRPKIILIERNGSRSVSIERVFRQVAREIGNDEFDLEFQSVPYGNGITAIVKNLLLFRPMPAAVYHITGDVHYIAMRLPGNRTVLTIHDLVFLRRRTGLRRWLIKKLFLDIPLERVRYVSTISDATAEEIYRIQGSRPRVIPNPMLDGFDPLPERSFDDECPVILQIGTAENKNLAALIEAVEGFTCRLRIIGRIPDQQVSTLEARRIDYENVYELDDAEMVEEYRSSDMLYFCSTYEGFGLPIIEAQAMRKPVITSDLEPMRSIAGEGAAFAAPTDPGSIRAAIERVARDPDYRLKLVRAGEENVRRFPASRSAEAYEQLYREILKGS
jgi:glycosyltransferase involved in cell wall biosynthesis